MKLLPLLQVSWLSTHRSMRWLSVVVFVLCIGGAIAVGVFATKPDRWAGVVMLYGTGLCFLWAFFFSTSILLAVDTRQLRVPGIQRQIVLSLGLYGALGIALPLMVLSFTGAPLLRAAIMLALFGSCGLAFALMPRYVAVFIGLTPSLFNALWHRFKLPGMDDPRFAAWAALLALALLFANAWRWRQLLHAGTAQAKGWSSPMVMQFRNGSWGYWSNLGDNRRLRQRPAWLQLEPNLNGAGPGAPRETLRLALGGWYMPQTTRSYVRQLSMLIGIIALPLAVIAAFALMGDHHAGVADVLKGGLIGGLGSLAVIAGPMVCLTSLQWLRRRWERANAELSLLALLPGLGDPARIKRQLLRAGLGLPLGLHALLALVLVVAMLFWRDHEGLLRLMLLAQMGTAAITTATVINLFGGRALPLWGIVLTLGASFVLTVLSLLLPAMTWGRHPVTWAASSLPWLVLAWLSLGGAMYWLGRRGWHALLQRPHPFFPS